ncbi:phage tail protein [Desulfitobacterium chlororespirans]|uniref:Phage protein U n=1 Tax=Desulfitobacterium chlororespirans DSM 11544 TaxID=1121395 RepID=A0A1M7U2S3_9FIRM|nr:phage tail protein [Desulfitobacterium chlororespirans]SHN77194.1 Phage protein U [Desulfitobacterium chlororespirans DSM 11544]
MAKVGSFGDIVFEVSEKKTLTFANFERKGSARWSDHEILNYKPISEFIGSSLEELSFTILLKAELGVNPLKELERLRKMRDTGKVAPLIIGERPVSENQWSIQQLSESYKTIDDQGNVLSAEVNLGLKEYYAKKMVT